MVKKQYADPVDYARFMGKYSRCVQVGRSRLGGGGTKAVRAVLHRHHTELKNLVQKNIDTVDKQDWLNSVVSFLFSSGEKDYRI